MGPAILGHQGEQQQGHTLRPGIYVGQQRAAVEDLLWRPNATTGAKPWGSAAHCTTWHQASRRMCGDLFKAVAQRVGQRDQHLVEDVVEVVERANGPKGVEPLSTVTRAARKDMAGTSMIFERILFSPSEAGLGDSGLASPGSVVLQSQRKAQPSVFLTPAQALVDGGTC